eukprot:gene10586-7110_t
MLLTVRTAVEDFATMYGERRPRTQACLISCACTRCPSYGVSPLNGYIFWHAGVKAAYKVFDRIEKWHYGFFSAQAGTALSYGTYYSPCRKDGVPHDGAGSCVQMARTVRAGWEQLALMVGDALSAICGIAPLRLREAPARAPLRLPDAVREIIGSPQSVRAAVLEAVSQPG